MFISIHVYDISNKKVSLSRSIVTTFSLHMTTDWNNLIRIFLLLLHSSSVSQTVQQRGAAVIKARKLSSAMSAAKAICDHMRDIWTGTSEVNFFFRALAP